MRIIVIIGAGGHGREVADVLQHQARVGESVECIGFVDDDVALHGRDVGGLPVLGGFSWFDDADREGVEVIVAIGDPATCRRVVQRARKKNIRFASAISPEAYVSPRAKLGAGVMIFPKAVVQPDAHIGDHATLNVAATVSHDSVVAPFANINPGAHLAGSVKVGEGAFIGMGADVVQGTSIGAWTTVGAGAAVIHDLPSNVTAVGVPARVIKRHDVNGRAASSAQIKHR